MQSEPTGGRHWAAVIGLSVDQLVAWGVLYYSYSVLAVPIARDLGVPTSTVAAAFSGSLLISSVLARRVGRLLDTAGARPVLLCGAVIGPLALGGLAAVERELQLFLSFAGLGIARASSLYEPAFCAIVDWSAGARQRSRALLVLTSVAGFASTVFLPLTALLLSAFGWRTAVLVLAALAAVVTLPIRLLLPRGGPRRLRSREPTSSPAVGGACVRLLSAGLALQAFAATGAMVCLVWLLFERGQTLEQAAALAGVAGASQVPSRLLLPALSRALSTAIRVPALLIIQAVALLGIAVLTGPALVAAVVTFGAAAGVMTLERAAIVLEWFGPESFGTGSGQLASSASLARAGAPFAIELLRASFSYEGVLGLLALCLLSGSALLAAAAAAPRPS